MNACFPIAVSPFSSGSSDGGLEIRRFFALPGAFVMAESLSSESCTEIFRLIRCKVKPNRTWCKRVEIVRTYPLRLFFVREHIDVNGIAAGGRAPRAVTLSAGRPGKCGAHDGGCAGFTRIRGVIQR